MSCEELEKSDAPLRAGLKKKLRRRGGFGQRVPSDWSDRRGKGPILRVLRCIKGNDEKKDTTMPVEKGDPLPFGCGVVRQQWGGGEAFS